MASVMKSLTLEICCIILGAQMDFVTETMLCKVFRPGDGKPIDTELAHAHCNKLSTSLMRDRTFFAN